MKTLRIGTRKSSLALAQSECVRMALSEMLPEVECELVGITTSGDRKRCAPENTLRDKKEWILEIEAALCQGTVDLAVHSGKDIPINIDERTDLLPVLSRGDPFDIFVLKTPFAKKDASFFSLLEQGARVGTSSLRRRAQILRLRPDLVVEPLRGNVPTRLRKLKEEPGWDALVLAGAGLKRLELELESHGVFSSGELLPAVNQGTLVVQYDRQSADVKNIVEGLVEKNTYDCWSAERAAIEVLNADCESCVGVFAESRENQLNIRLRVLSGDGSVCIEDEISGEPGLAKDLGRRVAEAVLAAGAGEYL